MDLDFDFDETWLFELVTPSVLQAQHLFALINLFDTCETKMSTSTLRQHGMKVIVHPHISTTRGNQKYLIPLGYIRYIEYFDNVPETEIYFIKHICDFSQTCAIKPYIPLNTDLVLEMISLFHKFIVENKKKTYAISSYIAKNHDEYEYFTDVLQYDFGLRTYLKQRGFSKTYVAFKYGPNDIYNIFKVFE